MHRAIWWASIGLRLLGVGIVMLGVGIMGTGTVALRLARRVRLLAAQWDRGKSRR